MTPINTTMHAHTEEQSVCWADSSISFTSRHVIRWSFFGIITAYEDDSATLIEQDHVQIMQMRHIIIEHRIHGRIEPVHEGLSPSAPAFAPRANQITLEVEKLTVESIKQIYLDCSSDGEWQTLSSNSTPS